MTKPKEKKQPIERPPVDFRHPTKTYWPVEEHLPVDEEPVLAYSEVWGAYYFAIFTPHGGWKTDSGESLQNITHWCDDKLFLPWSIRNEYDASLGKKYGVKNPRYGYT